METGLRIEWTEKEKPNVNQWYRCKDDKKVDFWKIRKEFHSEETRKTYYRIVSYYYGMDIYEDLTLAKAREIMKDWTFRKAV